MLDLNYVRKHPEEVKRAAKGKHDHAEVDKLLELDSRRRGLIFESEQLRKRLNEASKEIGRFKNEGKDASAQMAEMKTWLGDREASSTTQVTCGDFFETRDEALRAHACQVPPDAPFFFWPNDVQREVWPFEDYQLARSLVDSALPESDLFAGIPRARHLSTDLEVNA